MTSAASDPLEMFDWILAAAQPEAELLSGTDVVGFGSALRCVAAGLARNPAGLAGAVGRLGTGLATLGVAAAGRMFGADTEPVMTGDAKDRRFREPAFEHNAFFFGVHQGYLLWARLLDDLVEAADVGPQTRAKAQFAVRLLADALAPTNTLAGNPAALRKAFDTGGLSLARGARNALDDLAHNGGLPRSVDTTPFEVGRNLAATPGAVVYRNELIELIQYEAQTDKVHAVPLVLSPPWINKYYIMDLAPGRSFAEWAVQHGHTTFAISYRNPDASMRDVTFDDYLTLGSLAALDAIREITGQEQANIVALCLGGTLTTILLAHLAARGEDRVRSATLLNTLVDFAEPGALGVFTDEATVTRLEESMAEQGYLDAAQMASTFKLLRANDLIFNYIGSNWLMGERPPAFDILAWDSDSTRMPAAMHSRYLRSCYIGNELARGEMEVAGTKLRLDDIRTDVYVLGAREDHIAPWTTQYRTTQLLPSTRFVLSTAGHIAGIVNPPGPKASHWTNENRPPDPQSWLAGATQHDGSWWEDWVAWIGARAGPRRARRAVGSDGHPPLGPAPGTYVHEA